MSTYSPPMCSTCAKLKAVPKFIGDLAKCTAYPKGVPRKIYFQSGDCTHYQAQERYIDKNPRGLDYEDILKWCPAEIE